MNRKRWLHWREKRQQLQGQHEREKQCRSSMDNAIAGELTTFT